MVASEETDGESVAGGAAADTAVAMTADVNKADNLQPKVEKIFIDNSEKEWGPEERCWDASGGRFIVILGEKTRDETAKSHAQTTQSISGNCNFHEKTASNGW